MKYSFYAKKMRPLLAEAKRCNKAYYDLAKRIQKLERKEAVITNMFDRDADMTAAQETKFYNISDKIDKLLHSF